MNPTVLVVDDEQAICWGLSQIAREMGCDVLTAASAEEAWDVAARHRIDAAVIDVRLPGQSGLVAMAELRRRAGPIPMIVMTAYGDLRVAVEAVRQGAFEYLVKPFDMTTFRRALTRALELSNAPPAPALVLDSVEGFVAKSAAMQHVFNEIALAANSDANVLVEGESGTGKELVARAIHRFSNRAQQPLVAVHLAALAPTLIESELFGYVKGAFTGADSEKAGLLKHADGGTLFLDEVAEIPLAMQVKLLRVLEQREFTPVGSTQSHPVNFRLVTATHRNLYDWTQRGLFRQDLFFRISVFRIKLPPLRERREDILPLALHMLAEWNQANQAQCRLSDAAADELQRRDWSGNIRELKHVLEKAAIVARGGIVDVHHLPPPIAMSVEAAGTSQSSFPVETIGEHLIGWTREQLQNLDTHGQIYDRLLALVEKPVFETVLEQCRGQLTHASKLLGIHRTTLKKRLGDSP